MALEDFGGAELPPEDLASLGSKRIADPNSLKAVSYTHLDVYKRQPNSWAKPQRADFHEYVHGYSC